MYDDFRIKSRFRFYVQLLSGKVVELRTKYPKSKILVKVQEFYNQSIIPWMEDFKLIGKEMEIAEDEKLKNLILEWITTINKILRK